MRTTFISTQTMMGAPRSNLMRMQAELAKAGKEVATGRLADMGLGLGNETGRSVSLRLATDALQNLIDSNAVPKARLDRSQVSLQGIREGASGLLHAIVSAPGTEVSIASLESHARSLRGAFIDTLNGVEGGRHLFGGINSAQAPMAPYDGAPKTAVDAAFATRFGLPAIDPQSSPLVTAITPADMADFLDNEFAALFADPAWGTTWSSASDQNLGSRISTTEKIETSANANEAAIRKVVMAYTMVTDLGSQNLRSDTLQVILDRATALLGASVTGITEIEGRLGFAQNRLSGASERMAQEQDIVKLRIDALEGVDPVEAKARIDMLSTQIQMSYAVTTQFLGLSILNYV